MIRPPQVSFGMAVPSNVSESRQAHARSLVVKTQKALAPIVQQLDAVKKEVGFTTGNGAHTAVCNPPDIEQFKTVARCWSEAMKVHDALLPGGPSILKDAQEGPLRDVKDQITELWTTMCDSVADLEAQLQAQHGLAPALNSSAILDALSNDRDMQDVVVAPYLLNSLLRQETNGLVATVSRKLNELV